MAANLPSGKSTIKTSIPSVHASSAERSTERREPAPTDRKKSPDPRHLAIALHHAHQIQARKDTEALILSRIVDLIESPSSTGADASTPSPEHAAAVKSALRPFQPSDYDDLIQERNIDGRCGYVLCPKEHRKEDPKAKFRILWGPKGSGPGGRGKEMRIVPKEKLEMWCSDECAERAMYIRVQLSETPAWERAERVNSDIKLLEEARQLKRERDETADTPTDAVEQKMRDLAIEKHDAQDPNALSARLGRLGVAEDTPEASNSRQLALERGDSTRDPTLEVGKVDVNIQEKLPSSASRVSAPTADAHTSSGGSIEGYNPRNRSNIEDMEDVEDDDILPYI